MKSTDQFKKVVNDYLDKTAEEDPVFAEKMNDPKKSMDDCITYILNQVKASGCNGFTDAEIFGMAIHYFDEPDLKPGNKINCQVIVNHKSDLTPEEIEKAKNAAREKVIAEETERLRKRPVVKKPEPEKVAQPSLF